jgi:hypothetical protein
LGLLGFFFKIWLAIYNKHKKVDLLSSVGGNLLQVHTGKNQNKSTTFIAGLCPIE